MTTPRQLTILIAGGGGYIGHNLARAMAPDHDVVITLRPGGSVPPSLPGVKAIEQDLLDEPGVEKLVRSAAPHCVIDVAGTKNLGFCEEQPDEAMRINCRAPEHLAQSAHAVGSGFVFVSSDYVFDCIAGGFREEDATSPMTEYGRTKLCAEQAVMAAHPAAAVVRTSAVYGRGGGQFYTWLCRTLARGGVVDAFDDSIFTPTLIDDLAQALGRITLEGHSGIFHVAGSTAITRYGMACAVAEAFDYPPGLVIKGKRQDAQKLIAMNSSLDASRSAEQLDLVFHDLKTGLGILKESGVTDE